MKEPIETENLVNGLQSSKSAQNLNNAQDYKRLLLVITHPKHSVLVTLSNKQTPPHTKAFHYDEQNNVVSLEEIGEELILAEGAKEIVLEHITSPFSHREYEQSNITSLDPIELLESQINNIRELMQNAEEHEALETLKEANVNNEVVARYLLLALHKPDTNMGIAVFANRNQTGYPVKPLGILTQGNHLWTVEASNHKQNTVIIRHVSREKLFSRIATLLP